MLTLRFPRRLIKDERGVSAVEFALVAPLMVSLYLGCVEISGGVSADRKVSLTASTVANLVAQSTTLSSDDMNNVLDAATAIMQPYSASGLSITVSCIAIDGNKAATVKWSKARNGTPLSGTANIPTDLKVPNTQIILAQASYIYTPTVGYTITGPLTLSDRMYMMPRISAPIYDSKTCS